MSPEAAASGQEMAVVWNSMHVNVRYEHDDGSADIVVHQRRLDV